MTMKIRELEAFSAFMQHGTMQTAAQALGLSQSAISRLLASLESGIGFQLFFRKKNALSATREAELFYRNVERLLSNLREVEATAQAISKQQLGDLTIAAAPIFCDTFLLDAVAEFRTSHPEINVKLHDVGMVDLLSMVRHYRCDIGFGITLGLDQPDADVTRLAHCEARCIMPMGHDLDAGPVVPLKDLADATFVELLSGSPLRTRVDALFEEGGTPRRVAAEMRHLRGVVALVERGVGVAVVDPLSEMTMDRNKAVSRRISPSISWALALYQPRDQPMAEVARAFCEVVDRQIQKLKEAGTVLP
ncbi:LysR family transcriptional regulator [Limimaricola litoreus]|uniref:LysR family transcriptional regulator n=1 Tax=Limimaricola litoreus TaxID=2955316 RepID=A0A9X2FTB8_9RHOB|nr:LysR family transcriptional regulator [Limimaricola litoreus]MCP1170345.1 LysR family transcriptional regulator [Limimaricola litoreus]